jgi:predicted nucleic acid-binding protein
VSGPDVVVDTNVFVSARNRHERGYPACRKLIDRIDAGEFRAIISAITIAELRAGFSPEEVRTVWRAVLSHFLTSSNYRVEPVAVDIADSAGELRAASHLTLPDAIVVATGQLRGASLLFTQDSELARRQSVLAVKSPDELV